MHPTPCLLCVIVEEMAESHLKLCLLVILLIQLFSPPNLLVRLRLHVGGRERLSVVCGDVGDVSSVLFSGIVFEFTTEGVDTLLNGAAGAFEANNRSLTRRPSPLFESGLKAGP